MDTNKISYAGVGGAVAGVIGVIGVYANWWETADTTFAGTADASGSLALAMAIGLFAFGGAYILLSDAGIRRAMGALVAITGLVLALAGIWGSTRAEEVAAGAEAAMGLWISIIGGALGLVAGVLAMRETQAVDAGSTSSS